METMKKSAPAFRSPGSSLIIFAMLILMAFVTSGAVRAMPQVRKHVITLGDSWSNQMAIAIFLFILSVSFLNPRWVMCQSILIKCLLYVCPSAWLLLLALWGLK